MFVNEHVPIYSLADKFAPTALINSNPQSIHVKMHCRKRSSQKTPLLTYKVTEILQVSLVIYMSVDPNTDTIIQVQDKSENWV